MHDEFGRESLEKDAKNLVWKFAGSNAEVYVVKFTSGKLRTELDKRQASKSLIEKFQRVGEDINRLLSGEGDRKSDAIEREAVLLQKKSLRMEEESERLQKRKDEDFSNSQAKALKKKSEELQLQVDSLKRELEKIREEE